MALTETTETDFDVRGVNIQVRTATIVLRDGVEISREYHRRVFTPLDDISGLSEGIQAWANVEWTDEVKEAFSAS